jgi:hypothetical protein
MYKKNRMRGDNNVHNYVVKENSMSGYSSSKNVSINSSSIRFDTRQKVRIVTNSNLIYFLGNDSLVLLYRV